MLLRFDASLQRKDSRLYFFTGYIAYVVGLLTTFIVMHVFKAAQLRGRARAPGTHSGEFRQNFRDKSPRPDTVSWHHQ
ncbi:Minor histocompatibility antigen H13 [Fasciola gigantica]|uniref:Minor histocompatibility antigen H13 n=1 Tax=Fasciola gigantica TaxID=46835 RepID=A0A504YPT4_FASGI|nr:Minor histocompatibility antigen H13 [Fasciola gigantica]